MFVLSRNAKEIIKNGTKVIIFSFTKHLNLLDSLICAIEKENIVPNKYSKVSKFVYIIFFHIECEKH